jgi:hypothetical protein
VECYQEVGENKFDWSEKEPKGGWPIGGPVHIIAPKLVLEVEGFEHP